MDSKTAAMGLGLLVEIAYRILQDEKDIEKVVNELEKTRENIRLYAFVDTLKYLQKGGRLSATQAVLGGILNVKPILELKLGKISSFDKARGSKAAIKKIIDIAKESDIDTNYPISFGHVKSLEELENVINGIKEETGIKDYFIQQIGTVVATHAGPGAVGYALVIK